MKTQILYLTPEIVPFSKTGGLADVSGALPVELENLGAEIMVVTPYYTQVREHFEGAGDEANVVEGEATLWLGGRCQEYRVLKSLLPGSAVEVYFLDFPALFERPELYQENGDDYRDNFFRFAFFSKASLELAATIGFSPDIVHLNDWQSSLAAAYLKTTYSDDSALRSASIVLTIHNLAYQGLFLKEYLPASDLGWDLFTENGLEFWGGINCLKGGIIFSDAVTTVSPTYAEEIQTEEYGYGLGGLLTHLSHKLSGIVNGIDDDKWNPETDGLIPHNYTSKNLTGKTKCKTALREEVGLTGKKGRFLVGMISRLADQKGFDLIAGKFDELMALDLELVLLGTGKPEYHRFFEEMAEKYPGKFSANLKFDERLAHLIEAGCDAFLMPSRYEPCGLNQLYSLGYGTIPIVRATGGLKDTVVNVTEKGIGAGKSTGFRFKEYDAGKMLGAVEKALRLYSEKSGLWKKLVKNAMAKDFSWKRSAESYLSLYGNLRLL